MATVRVFTAARSQEIEDASIDEAKIIGNNLVLRKKDASEFVVEGISKDVSQMAYSVSGEPGVGDAYPLSPLVPAPLIPIDWDTIWRQDVNLQSDILIAGCKGNTVPETNNYGNENKLITFGGSFSGPPSIPSYVSSGLSIPTDGLLPNDEFAIAFKLGNFMGSDFTTAAHVANNALITLGRLLFTRSAANQLALYDFGTTMLASLTIPVGWLNNTWRSFVIRYKRNPQEWSLQMENDYAGRAVASAAGTPRSANKPFDTSFYTPGGPSAFQPIAIGGNSVQAANLALYVTDLTIYRYRRGHNAAESKARPRITIDLNSNLGTFPSRACGTLGIHEAFPGYGLPTADMLNIAQRQFDIVMGQAGMRYMRSCIENQNVGVTGTPAGTSSVFTYDWSELEYFLDLETEHLPENGTILLMADYCPEIVQPGGGTEQSVPTDIGAWARIVVDKFVHAKQYKPDVNFDFGFWNEPDLTDYFSGTLTQAYSMWKQLQELLISEFPSDSSMRISTPDYSNASAHLDFVTRLNADANASTLKASIKAIHHHCYHQSIADVLDDALNIRGLYTGIGVSTNVPMRFTEYDVSLSIALEQSNDPESWWRTQPSVRHTVFNPAWGLAMLIWYLSHPTINCDASVFSIMGHTWHNRGLTRTHADENPFPNQTLGAVFAVNRLKGTKLTCTPNWPNFTAIAAKDVDGRVAVAFASFRPLWGYRDHVAFRWDFNGTLPTTYVWKLWQLDAHTPSQNMELVGSGSEEHPPSRVSIGALGLGLLEIIPTS